jgi:hypothetical protein
MNLGEVRVMAWLRYKMRLTEATPKVPGTTLTAGVLEILDGAGKVLATYNRTTSGARGYQEPKHQYTVGLGPIPSCNTAGIPNWRVATTSYPLSDPGVNGQFFSIQPSPHVFGGVSREQFGIHFDANFSSSPGSAGCIVFTDSTQWSNFQKWMSDYRTKYLPGAKEINLIVQYS